MRHRTCAELTVTRGPLNALAAPTPEEALVPLVSMKETLDRAFAERYGVPAINIVNDLTIEAVLAAAVEERSPVILQTSVKTVKMYGREQLHGIFAAMVRDVDVPVTLHLDHCPDRAVISSCLEAGWNSVLFDAHELDVAENLRQTTEVVQEARRYGAHVEGESRASRVSRTVWARTRPRCSSPSRSQSTSSSARASTASRRRSATPTGSTSRHRCSTTSG